MSTTPLTFGDFYTLAWNMVPSVWREADDAYGKSLQIVLYTISQHMYYYFYNKAIHMDELFDPDLCPEKYLVFLAGMLGWTLQGNDPVSWREQIKAAPLLYKIRGTKRGLLLAEKLVGYSVFMSELYRDHIGDIVPKEKIFNNIPESVKIKPWFRKTLNSLEGELLPGQAESDQFDSFNATGLVKLDAFGQVIRPRILSSTRKLIFTPSSTTVRYNNITGKNSLARYAKLPRINIVLKYEHDLDEENIDGSIKENNFSGALDLLLQFKPFHVLIQGLEVRYDLSEFIFDQTNINTEALNTQDQFDAAVSLITDRTENTINYSINPPVAETTLTQTIPITSLDNRGVISSVYQIIDLTSLVPSIDPSLSSVSKLSLPTKSFEAVDMTVADTTYAGALLNTVGVYGDKIYTRDDFNLQLPYSTVNESFVVKNDDNTYGLVYNVGHAVLQYNLTNFIQDPILDYRTMMSIQRDSVPLKQLTSISISSNIMTITVPVGHNLHSGDTVSIILNSPSTYAQYSGIYNVLSDPDPEINPTLFSIELPISASSFTLTFAASGTIKESSIYIKTVDNTVSTGGFNKNVIEDYSLGLRSSNIMDINISNIPYRSSITTDYGLQSIDATPSTPWDLQEVQEFITNALNSNMSTLDTFKWVYDNTIMVVLEQPPPTLDPKYLGYDIDGYEYPGYIQSYGITSSFILLDPNLDYYFDNTNNIFLNSSSIAGKMPVTPDRYNFLKSCKLHILYLSRKTYENETEDGIPFRGFRYTSRINHRFSRQFLVNSLPQPTLTNIMPTEISSVDIKTKQKTVLGIKKFKLNTNIYNRSSLKNQSINGYTVVSRDELNRVDNTKWSVYSPEYAPLYLGDQTLTNNWWGNYYGAKVPDMAPGTPAFIPYNDINISENAQVEDVSSDQWLAALQTLNTSSPNDFLAVRTTDENRASIWNRSSCKLTSVPFIRGRRDSLQVFRKDIPTFTRTEESTDYSINITTPPRIDNYKYILSDTTNVSSPYFNPGFVDTTSEAVIVDENKRTRTTSTYPTIDRGIGSKATIGVMGAGASFSKDKMTLSTVPNTGTISVGQLVIGNNIPNNTFITGLFSGVINAVNSIYTLSTFVGTLAAQDISIGNIGYNISFPSSDTYYTNASSNLEQKDYFTPGFKIKTSLYAGNIPVNLDPSNPGMTEGLDRLDLLITGLETVIDTFTATSGNNEFILSHSNLWVSWLEVDTGNAVAYGYYPNYIGKAIPNIKVWLNGILLSYGVNWVLGIDNSTKAINILDFIETSDTVIVQYQTISGQTNIITNPPNPQIPQTIHISLSNNDISTIQLGNRYIISLPNIINIPCISWYNSTTAAFINYGITPIDYKPSAPYSLAVPNMTIKLNNTLLTYKKDWDFLLLVENSTIIANVAISPEISLALGVGNTIDIDYFSTT